MTDLFFKSVLGNFKNRTFQLNKLTRVHRNLHNGKWVISQKINNKWVVCHYADSVNLIDTKFIISEKSRLRAVNQKCRNVHAYVEGILFSADASVEDYPTRFSYNPFKAAYFYTVLDEKKLPEGKAIIFNKSTSSILI
jgi:hypothetical protein